MYVVYEITTNIDDRRYIGSTKNPDKRFKRHKKHLENNSHHSVYFQRFYTKHKENITLSFNILDRLDTEAECRQAEQTYLDKHYNSLLNTSKFASGGDLLSYHPRRQEIIKKMRRSLKEGFASGKRQSVRLYGSKNPNFKNKGFIISVSFCPACKKERETYKKDEDGLCRSCLAKTRVGSKNPFYGKTHTKQSKAAMSKTRRKKYTQNVEDGIHPSTSIPVFAYGVLYASLTLASRSLGITAGALHSRINSKNWEYRSVYKANSPKNFNDLIVSDKDCICAIDGIEYSSPGEASSVLQIPYSTVIFRCKSDKNKSYYLKRPTSIENEYQIVFSE